MIAGGAGIRLEASPALRLRSGETVLLTPIRRLSGDRWVVSLRGQVLVARSSLALVPGSSIRARVGTAGAEVTLNPMRRLLHRAGLPDDPLSERIVTALLRSGIAPDTRWVSGVRRLLAGREGANDRLIRLITVLLDKNLDPRSDGLERVLGLLGDGSGGQRRERRRDARKDHGSEGEQGEEGLARQLKQGITRGASGQADGDFASPLPLLNHLAAGHQHWVLIPYRLSGNGRALSGILRILYDPHLKESRRMVVDCREEGGAEWAFVLTRRGRESSLAAFCSEPVSRRRGWGGPTGLKAKLHNLGIEVDDTIREYRDFDGFSMPEEGPRVQEVDTWR